ncbi:MAG: AsmA-like C-terminal region-containing protein, partial [Planctomycetota bacterium]
DLLAAAPESTRRRLAGLQAAASAAGRVTLKRADRAAPWAWGGVVSVSDGAIRHPRLPRPLTELRATASFNAAGVAVRSLSAKLGAAEITGALNHTGWRAGGPIALQGRVRGLTLDQPLRAALPQRLQTLWRRFKPAGVVDVALQSRYGDHRWRHDATIDCRTLSVEDSERFPYRLTNAQGTARLADAGEPGQGRCALQLRGLAEGRPVVIAAEFRGLPCPGDPPRPPPPGPRPICPVGWVEINAPQLRASEALLAAIRPHRQAAAIARALAPTGDFGARWRLDRPTADQLQPAMEIDLRALGCSIRYDKFPYPIHGIYGDLRLRNGVWSFDRLESRSATGPQVIVASGGLAPEDGRQTFRMRLTATAARLDEPLRRALPEREQAVWSRLRPAGRVSLTTDVLYRVGDAAPQIAIVAEPFERSVSLEPDFFPYRLSRLGGRFVMRDGRMSFTGGLAEHGRSRFAAAGSWTPLDAGGWRFELTGLSADYLDADHDLRLAAPIALRRVIDEVQPEGGFGLHDGRLAFTYDPRRPDDLRTDWDVELDCHQADVTFGSRVEGVSGAVRLTGVSTGGDCRAYGQLQLDTMFWNGLQLTNVRGPLWAGAGECLLGEGVAAKLPGAKSERITAQVYGGTAAINTRAVYSEGTRYSMAIDLAGIDLGRFSTDYLNTEAPLTGVAGGRMLLSGKGSSVFGIEGSGTMQVRDADLYQLPVMVALLKVLSNRTPDTRAFDGVNAEFTVQGKHLQFSRLDLVGDAVSLNGRGEASLDKNVNLTFHTIVGRTSDRFSMLRSLVGQASEQILRVRVLGTIDNPDIRRDALPVVGSVLEQLRADLQPRPLSQPSNTPQAAALRRQSRTQ